MSNETHPQASLRIIDANLNRAREALRVMEDYARLGLGDAGLTSALKEARHLLAELANNFERNLRETPSRTSRTSAASGSLMAYRDIVGDVGCALTTPSEYQRADAVAVVRASAKRLSEALRAAEEFGKTVDVSFAAGVEQLRYRGYELERRLNLTVQARERVAQVKLYVMITESLCRADWFATAEAALRGGADCLQLREKGLADGELLDRAAKLANLCHQRGTLCIVNDRPDVALLAGADGVHLGQSDLPVRGVRGLGPPGLLLGASTHTLEQVEAVAPAVPDYIAVGPMFPTPTKPQDHVAGPSMLAAARACTSLPLVAVGGIDEENVTAVVSAAECAICVCQAVINQADVEAAAMRLRTAIEHATQERIAAESKMRPNGR